MVIKKWTENNKLLTITIILIFLIFTSYNISAWMVHKKYSDINALNDEIGILRDMVLKEESQEKIVQKIDEIHEVMTVIDEVCLK